MQLKLLIISVLFLAGPLLCWGQTAADDMFVKESLPKEEVPVKEKENVKENVPANIPANVPANESITIEVDQDIYTGGSSNERGMQDSEKSDEKWKLFFSEKNKEIEQILNSILMLDSNTVSRESIDEYILTVNTLKKEVESKLDREKNALWCDNDLLDKMNGYFFHSCDKAILKLNQLKEKLGKKKEPINKLLIIGICLLAVMAIVPIITQLKSSIVVKKLKKQQELLAKKQKEDMEKQMLLSDSNMVTLKH